MTKRMLAMGFAALAIAAHADTNATVSVDEIIGETVKVFEAEGWTAKDVADAVKSLRGLYVRDNATADGRKRWHGRVIETRVDTNTLQRTTVHEDGETFVDAARVVTAAASVAASNAKLKTTIATNGIPARLVAARARRQAEVEQVSNVTVTVTAGQK